MAIKDRDIRNALETLDTEIENLEAQNKEMEDALAEMETKVEELEQQALIDAERIQELEEALAEAYLTSEKDDEVSGEDVDVSSGCRSDVSDSTSDEAVN